MIYKCLECEEVFNCDKPTLEMQFGLYNMLTGFQEVVRCPRCNSEITTKQKFTRDGDIDDEDDEL